MEQSRRSSRRVDVSEQLRRLDLNLLLPFAVLLETRHVTQAAERLGIGQPAMSSALARLRRSFGDPLLVRHGHGLELTPLAQALAPRVLDVVAGLERLVDTHPTFDPGRDERSFSVVASDYATIVLLKPLLERVAREAPGVTVNVLPVIGTSVSALLHGGVDLVIAPNYLPAVQRVSDLRHEDLFSDECVATVCRSNRDVGSRFDADDAARVPYLRHHVVDGGLSHIDRQLAALGIQPRVAVTARSVLLIPALLPGTPMFAFVNRRLIDKLPDGDRLRVVPTSIPLEPFVETMYWHPVATTDPAHSWLRDHVSRLAATL